MTAIEIYMGILKIKRGIVFWYEKEIETGIPMICRRAELEGVYISTWSRVDTDIHFQGPRRIMVCACAKDREGGCWRGRWDDGEPR